MTTSNASAESPASGEDESQRTDPTGGLQDGSTSDLSGPPTVITEAASATGRVLSDDEADALASTFRPSWETDDAPSAAPDVPTGDIAPPLPPLEGTATQITLPEVSGSPQQETVIVQAPPSSEASPNLWLDDSGVHERDHTAPLPQLPVGGRSRNLVLGGAIGATVLLLALGFTLMRSMSRNVPPQHVSQEPAELGATAAPAPTTTEPSASPSAAIAPPAPPASPTAVTAVAPQPAASLPPSPAPSAHAAPPPVPVVSPSAAHAAAPVPPLPPPPQLVRIRIAAIPSNAQVIVDGRPQALPLDTRTERSSAEHAIFASAAGYIPKTLSQRFDRDLTLTIRLEPLPTPRPTPTPRATSRPAPQPPAPHARPTARPTPVRPPEPPRPRPSPTRRPSHGAGFVTDNPY